MKVLKIIGISIAAIVALLFIISIFLPSQMHVERSTVIHAPAGVVFEQVNTLRNMENWSPWQKMDPDMKPVYFGPESGTGAGYSWKGEKTGEGKLLITESIPNELIKTSLDFGEMGRASGGYHFEPVDSEMKVTWYFDSDTSGNPLFKYMYVMMKGMLEKEFDEGLAGIKKISENISQDTK